MEVDDRHQEATPTAEQQQPPNSDNTAIVQPQQVGGVVLPGEDVTDIILSTGSRHGKKTPKIGELCVCVCVCVCFILIKQLLISFFSFYFDFSSSITFW
jgi:hypothetical protein